MNHRARPPGEDPRTRRVLTPHRAQVQGRDLPAEGGRVAEPGAYRGRRRRPRHRSAGWPRCRPRPRRASRWRRSRRWTTSAATPSGRPATSPSSTPTCSASRHRRRRRGVRRRRSRHGRRRPRRVRRRVGRGARAAVRAGERADLPHPHRAGGAVQPLHPATAPAHRGPDGGGRGLVDARPGFRRRLRAGQRRGRPTGRSPTGSSWRTGGCPGCSRTGRWGSGRAHRPPRRGARDRRLPANPRLRLRYQPEFVARRRTSVSTPAAATGT